MNRQSKTEKKSVTRENIICFTKYSQKTKRGCSHFKPLCKPQSLAKKAKVKMRMVRFAISFRRAVNLREKDRKISRKHEHKKIPLMRRGLMTFHHVPRALPPGQILPGIFVYDPGVPGERARFARGEIRFRLGRRTRCKPIKP